MVADPTDYDCHQYLGDYYGYHEHDHEAARRHIDSAINLVPTSNSKALMFKVRGGRGVLWCSCIVHAAPPYSASPH